MTVDMRPKQPEFDFDKFLIDLSKEINEPQPLISLADKPLFTRGNISSISGKAKSRKTFLIGLFASDYFSNGGGSVMIFDTEQAMYHVQKSTKRIHRLLEWDENQNDNRLRVFYLREQCTEKRVVFVTRAITHFRPDLVFIDGVRDLLSDFNSIAESSQIVNLLMRLSSENNCHICAVLHENKADNNLRGHAGTELQNKSETVISVEADGSISEVIPKYCRNIPFEKFHFRINESGLPEYCDPEVKPKNAEKLVSLFSEILPEGVTMSYAELRSLVMGKCDVKDKTAEKKIKEASEQSVIVKNKAGMYYCVDINRNTVTEHELPF